MEKYYETVLTLIDRLQQFPTDALIRVREEPSGDGQLDILRIEMPEGVVLIVADTNGL